MITEQVGVWLLRYNECSVIEVNLITEQNCVRLSMYTSITEQNSVQLSMCLVIEVFGYRKYSFGISITERSVIEVLLY